MRKPTNQIPPRDLTCRVIRDGDPEIVLLSFASSSSSADVGLTSAECDVAIAIVRGLSNAEIAGERGVATRTIANQVASLMKKLGASSRVDLATRFTGFDQ